MIFGIADDGDAPAVGEDRLTFGNSLDRVVRSLAVDIWVEQLEKWCDRPLGKDRDVVHASNRGDELGAIGGFENRAARSLSGSDGIVINRHDETVGFCRGGLKITDMANVQEIENPVGEGDGAAGNAGLADSLDQIGP